MLGREIATALTNYVNSNATGKHDDFIQTILSDHKTLQQSTMRLVFNLIKAMAQQTNIDERNADAVQACKAIVERCINEMYLRFI